MKTRFNIAFVPIQTENEKYVFDNGMRAKFPISSIENLLFDKLLNELRKSHPSGLFSVWGIGAGEKSLNANNWNKLNSNDLVIFYTGLDSIVIAKVAQKFQSENVGRQIWPDSSESDVVQYVVTVDEILQFELKVKNNFSKAFYNKISSLNTFEVFENLALADIFSEGMLSSGLFLEFMARAEDVDIASISNILDNKIDDDSATTHTVNNSGFYVA